MMSKIEIKTFTESDWEIYKSLRLASLGDSPDSFGSTLVREAAFSDDEWKGRLNTSPGVLHTLTLVAYFEGRAVGLVSGVVHKENPASAHVYQLWVSPESRGVGIARALLTRIVSWSTELQLRSLLLAVTTTNTEAVSLYRSFGFVLDGETEPLRDGSELVIQPMKLDLGGIDE